LKFIISKQKKPPQINEMALFDFNTNIPFKSVIIQFKQKIEKE